MGFGMEPHEIKIGVMPLAALCSLYMPRIIKILQMHSFVTSKTVKWRESFNLGYPENERTM